MSYSKFVPGAIIRFTLLVFFCLVVFHPIMEQVETEPDFSLLLEQTSVLETGDIIFRRGIGPGSRFVDMVDEHSPFSHVGLVQKIGEAVFVIHAAPESLQGDGWVRQQPLVDFLAASTAVSIYRIQPDYRFLSETAVAETIAWIDAIPFDSAFDFATTEALYCTELVWLAYQRAGIDLVDNQFDELDLPFQFEGSYLFPSRLLHSPYLQNVIEVP